MSTGQKESLGVRQLLRNINYLIGTVVVVKTLINTKPFDCWNFFRVLIRIVSRHYSKGLDKTKISKSWKTITSKQVKKNKAFQKKIYGDVIDEKNGRNKSSNFQKLVLFTIRDKKHVSYHLIMCLCQVRHYLKVNWMRPFMNETHW